MRPMDQNLEHSFPVTDYNGYPIKSADLSACAGGFLLPLLKGSSLFLKGFPSFPGKPGLGGPNIVIVPAVENRQEVDIGIGGCGCGANAAPPYPSVGNFTDGHIGAPPHFD